ncbi:MAG: bifunctional RNase H/acid phosphatase [Micromonosporaceae bacterium]|nr:bifunctional RNase H/acid phosphatase [Micromonosporaceae bacterium]
MARARRLRVVVEADGGARGNPGPAGWGAVVREAATGEVLVELGESIGVATNNVAEYRGLIAGLQRAAELGAVEVEVRMDSRLVVEQMSGRWQIKNPGLRPLAAQAASLVSRFESVRFTWVPREQNQAADALANAAMDAAAAGVKPDVSQDALLPPGAQEGHPPDTSRREPRPPAPSGAASAPPKRWMPPPETGAARLLLVRHASTTLTEQRRYSGRGDVPLSPEGEAQATATAQRIAAMLARSGGASSPVVVTSPLTRCRRTAQVIADRIDASVLVEDALTECDFGAWEGLTFAEVRQVWPEELDAWLASPQVAPPGGESFAQVAARVAPAIARLTAEYAGRVVVVVTHVTPIKLVLRDALQATDALLHRLYLDAGGISVVDYWPDGGVAVRTVNDTAHLAG